VVADVGFRPRLDDDQPGAELARLGHADVALQAGGLGLEADRDAAGGLGHDGHDAERFPAQLRPLLLLHRGEEGVEVDGEVTQRHGIKIARKRRLARR